MTKALQCRDAEGRGLSFHLFALRGASREKERGLKRNPSVMLIM